MTFFDVSSYCLNVSHVTDLDENDYFGRKMFAEVGLKPCPRLSRFRHFYKGLIATFSMAGVPVLHPIRLRSIIAMMATTTWATG